MPASGEGLPPRRHQRVPTWELTPRRKGSIREGMEQKVELRDGLPVVAGEEAVPTVVLGPEEIESREEKGTLAVEGAFASSSPSPPAHLLPDPESPLLRSPLLFPLLIQPAFLHPLLDPSFSQW